MAAFCGIVNIDFRFDCPSQTVARVVALSPSTVPVLSHYGQILGFRALLFLCVCFEKQLDSAGV